MDVSYLNAIVEAVATYLVAFMIAIPVYVYTTDKWERESDES